MHRTGRVALRLQSSARVREAEAGDTAGRFPGPVNDADLEIERT